MIELPAMDACPTGKGGRHAIEGIAFDTHDAEDAADLTLFCAQCGAVRRLPTHGPVLAERMAVRRLPTHGPVLAERMDDLSADELIRVAGRGSPP